MKKFLFILFLCTLFAFPVLSRAESNISRQEFIQMINSSLSISSDSTAPLPDVSAGNPYFAHIRSAVDYGYIKGDEKGNINPEDFLTRAEAAVMLGRIMGTIPTDKTAFYDDHLIYDWAKPAVKSLTDLKIITGHDDYTYRPDDYLTKEQCKIIVTRIKDNLYAGGTGTENSPYIISSFFHLRNIALNPDKHYILSGNLNLLNCDFIYYPVNSFSGNLNGQGFKIIGLKSVTDDKSIFKTIASGGKVLNIKLSTPYSYFAFATENKGLIENCANISGQEKNKFTLSVEYSGNICSINTGIIKNCYNTSLITYANGYASGICGANSGTVINCFNTGNSDEDKTAGICALNFSVIENCFSTGYLSGDDSFAITWKNSDVKPTNCYYSSKMFSPGEKKVTQSALVSIFISLGDFELTEEMDFPTLKSNPFLNNENYTEFAGGDGSPLNPFIVAEKENLINVKSYPDAHFKQAADISLGKVKDFHTIGSRQAPFTGSYDGAGYKISDLILYSPLQDDISLFGYNQGEIKNVHLRNCLINGNTNIASLVLENNGTIKNCSADTHITAATGAGFALTNNGTISECNFYGYMKGGSTASAFVYENNGIIENCYTEGIVTGANAGGVSYINNSIIESCCSFTLISANKKGLLAFDNRGEITKSYYLNNQSAVSSTIRNIESYPRTKVQAEFKSSFELLDFNLWQLSKGDYPQLINNPKTSSLSENTTEFAGGNGSFGNPFKIVTPVHISNISKYPSKSFILMNNIDLSQLSKANDFIQTESFSGYFEGNGYTISNLNQAGISSLFNTNYGIISGLTTESFTLYGSQVAPICITNNGVITLCRNNSDISGENVSGIASENNSVINRCISNGNLSGNMAGGISSFNAGEISDCLVSADITGADNTSKIFGITSGGTILSSIVTGDLYFKEGIGRFFPVSDTPYVFCYYLDRYNEKSNGAIDFSQLITKKELSGINFSDIWVKQEGNFPYINGITSTGIKTPETYTAGDGSKENPFVILNANDLYNIRMYPNACFTVFSDIVWGNLTSEGILNNGGKGFTPIENFTGTLEGNNSIIYGIEILYSDTENAGIFTQNNGTVKNLGFSGIRVEGNMSTGALCGINNGVINNVKVLGSRIGSASGNAGGICGENYGVISACTNNSDIFAASSGGGITGVNHKTLLTSSNGGSIITVTDDHPAYSGGIAGKNNMTIEKCSNIGKVYSYSDKKSAFSGGIAGLLNGNVKTSYNTGDYTAKSSVSAIAGGIAGGGEKIKINNTYNIGYGLTTSPQSYIGSIVGAGTGSVSSSYYDHTLTYSCGGENINELSVFGINSDDFADLKKLTLFSEKVWNIPEESNYPYPQLIDNPHITKTYSDNVRDFGGGDGSIDNPYRILTAEHLDNVRKYLGSSFTLMGNIDMRRYIKTHEFAPIGDNIFGFFGTFSGNGFEIIGLETTGSTYGGLFRQNHGEIYDVKMTDGKLTATISGAVAAINNGLIYRCHSSMTSNVPTDQHITLGGIAGINQSSGMIVSCSNKSDLSSVARSIIVGGITASNNGVIAGSINYPELNISATSLAISGGISGTNSGTISDSANILNIITSGGTNTETYAGGITGTNSGTLINCYSASDVVSGKAYGGIVANNTSTTINCYYNDSVSIACTLGSCTATSVPLIDMTNPDTFIDFDFYEMWYATGTHLPVPFETLY